ncbi:hypothetical protein BU24DRAFT_481786 [Aaosphaeria arxii CBS 175.79]|uniref:Uncharacterized protein n=1 Tax=Aaosphaeria arxii CBS 175.79 TaxID=1450172 RepID=A0A6A5XM80_9PLEO|nr:uncharacterized protein BU24DRAFT_481786 [Aaosphaeria arxii CBS 175.79]KAF2014345.1 hypothetical protein BU24DRAFT_481786 [Aaosphaeria arxii CBS 175.79]
MPLLLAPYNDSMSLGQGFNSYTHELCIDKAVTVEQENIESEGSPAQDVTYTSRFVDKLSDVVNSMNISFSSSIKKGTVESNGSTSAIDETTFKDSNLNAVVRVKVTNQIISVNTKAEFNEIAGVIPGTPQFNDTYGDCYISGFIEGGEFNGIVSIKILDSTKTAKKIAEIKSALASPSNDELTLDAFGDNVNSNLTEKLRDSQTTISVSWQGGGQIKHAETQWNIDTMLAAAAAFPSNVAQKPQRTWAILTKYKANQSFVKKMAEKKHEISKVLQYDQVSTFTAELFDDFMDYKVLLNTLQDIISNRHEYTAQAGDNAIELTIANLLALKAAFRAEQSKIVQATEVLSRDPSILLRKANSLKGSGSTAVDDVIKKALQANLGRSVTKRQILTPPSPPADDGSTTTAEPDFDFSSLIPPEIFDDIMPKRIETPETQVGPLSALPTMLGLASAAPPPPATDGEVVGLPDGVMKQANSTLQTMLDLKEQELEDSVSKRNQYATKNQTLESELSELKVKTAADQIHIQMLTGERDTLKTNLVKAQEEKAEVLEAAKKSADAAKGAAEAAKKTKGDADTTHEEELRNMQLEANSYHASWKKVEGELSTEKAEVERLKGDKKVFKEFFASLERFQAVGPADMGNVTRMAALTLSVRAMGDN